MCLYSEKTRGDVGLCQLWICKLSEHQIATIRDFSCALAFVKGQLVLGPSLLCGPERECVGSLFITLYSDYKVCVYFESWIGEGMGGEI